MKKLIAFELKTAHHHLDNKLVTFGKQIGNKEITNEEQIGHAIDNNKSLILTHEQSIKKLSGIQKNIFYYVIKLCASRDALDTGNIFSNDLAFATQCTIASVKTSLTRLIAKKLIVRLPGKSSRGGYLILGITKEIQMACFKVQNAMVIDKNTGNNLDHIDPYSSSNKNITTTSLPDEWKKINIEPLQYIGFTESQLRQIWNCKTSEPAIVQDSINQFAFGLEYNQKIKNHSRPLNMLMGVLRKGDRWTEEKYISPKERVLQQEQKKRKNERDVMIKKLVEIEFPVWKRKLTQTEIEGIVSAYPLRINTDAAITDALRDYFVKKILLPRIEE